MDIEQLFLAGGSAVGGGGIVSLLVKRMLSQSDNEKVSMGEDVKRTREAVIRLEEKLELLATYLEKVSHIEVEHAEQKTKLETIEKEMGLLREKVNSNSNHIQLNNLKLAKMER